jgi:hypothetical protein
MDPRRIYTASSWKNKLYPEVVTTLRSWGHYVHDFRDPKMSYVFQWSKVAPNWEGWNQKDYIKALQSPQAIKGFQSDKTGILTTDTTLLILPCGKSAHLELGFAAGMGRQCFIYMDEELPKGKEGWEIELMYKFVEGSGGRIVTSLLGLRTALAETIK